MRPVLTAEEFQRAEQEHRGDLAIAMDRAGKAVADAAHRIGVGYGSRVVVLAGPGNNGGDGYVAARYLKARGVWVEVLALAEPRTDLARQARRLASQDGVRIRPFESHRRCDLVIDALFGGSARDGFDSEVVSWMSTGAPVVAVDYPTGLNPNTGAVGSEAFAAQTTVTFGALKTGHVRGAGPDLCGEIVVADVGIDGGRPSMFVAEESDAIRPARRRTAHKWSAGAVLVLGGSPGMVGAAAMTARAALEFGAGSVYAASPNPDLAHQAAPGIPTLGFGDVAEILDRFDVVVAGPGLSEDDRDSIVPILPRSGRVLLDAGALTPEILEESKMAGVELVLTPHRAEFSRVSGGLSPGDHAIRAFASKHRATLLLKGNPTVISDGSPPVVVNAGGPELASIGTGDVLAGMIAALWARGLSGTDAAVSGSYWHGVLGSELSKEGSVTAMRMLDEARRFAW